MDASDRLVTVKRNMALRTLWQLWARREEIIPKFGGVRAEEILDKIERRKLLYWLRRTGQSF